jgi:hypothetical protein
MPLHDFAFAAKQSLLCAVDELHVCHIYKTSTGAEGKSISVLHDIGGRRIAVHPTMPHAYVGCYHIHGIASYNLDSGTEVWRVRALKKIQTIHVDGSGSRILVGLEEGPLLILNSKNGKWLEKIRGAKQCWAEGNTYVYHSRETFTVRVGDRRGVFKTGSFGVLSTHITADEVYVSVPGGSVFVVDIPTLSITDEYVPPKGSHVLQIVRDDVGRVVGLQWEYERGGEQLIVDLSNHCILCRISVRPAFMLSGTRTMVSHSGEFLSWTDETEGL